MKDTSCTSERDVLDLVAVGQWPSRADAALRAHVAACATCAEVAAVASAVRDWADVEPAGKVPDASVVWYRAQVRAREEASRRASRPVVAVQLIAVAAVVLAIVTMGPGAGWYWSLLSGVNLEAVTLPTMNLPDIDLSALSQWSWLGLGVLGAAGALVLAGGVALAVTARE